MSKIYDKLEVCMKSIRKQTDFKPETALILGSGLGDYADEIRIEQTVAYTEIEGFPVSTVAGHIRKVRIRLRERDAGGHHAGKSALL